MGSPAVLLMERLGLSDEELCAVLDADPLSLIGGQLDGRPELAVLLALTGEAVDRVGGPLLRRWVRTAGPSGRPLDLLLQHDFAGFEDALDALERRGFVIGG